MGSILLRYFVPLQLMTGVGFIWGELVLALDAYLVREWFSLQVKSNAGHNLSQVRNVEIRYSPSDGLVCSGALLSVSILPRARVLQVAGQNREAGTGQS